MNPESKGADLEYISEQGEKPMEAEVMPVVNPADLAAAFNFYRDLQSQYGGVGVAYSVPPERLEALCSPGAGV